MSETYWDETGDLVAPFVPVDRAALAQSAAAWFNAGASLLPVRLDGSKAPGGGDWKAAQSAQTPVGLLAQWFNPQLTTFTDGLGAIMGDISGGIEMLEFEGRALTQGFDGVALTLMDDNGIGDVWRRITTGYVERSAGGGVHYFLRTDGPARGNTKIAVQMDHVNLTPTGKPTAHTLIETRGEGGFVVLAPSAGRSRAKGGAWTVVSGSPATIPTVTVDERDHMYAVLSFLDQRPARTDRPAAPIVGAAGTEPGLRPGDDFNERVDWADDMLLAGAGWVRKYRVNRGWGWARPGKTTPGLSATTGQAGTGAQDRLFIFSSSTDWPTEEPLTKFWVYAELHHAGDLKAAARELGRKGFGTDDYVATNPFAAYEGDGATRGQDPTAPAPSPSQQQTSATTLTNAGDTVNPWHVSAPDTVPTDFGPPVDQQDPSPARVLAGTQVAHSQLLINEYGPTIRYCAELETWLVWEHHVWRKQARDGGGVFEAGKQVAMMMSEQSDEHKKWKRAALTSGGIGAALRLAQTSPAVRVPLDMLDAHGWELNTPAGVIDLHTGTLIGPIAEHLHTKATTCAPDFDAYQGAWTDFLSTTFGGDIEIINWMQRLLGYACVGEVLEHILPVFYGVGSNGKSVLLEVVGKILGDYAVTMPPRYLVEGEESTSDTASLQGARLAIMSETNEGERFAEALAKRITGGDTLTGRLLYKDWISWTPTHTAVLTTNHRLEVPSGGRSFWRRIREVPFNNIVPDAQRDEKLTQRLVTEHGPAILAWLAQGAALYAKHGLQDPTQVTIATSDYERSTDSVGRFVDEECRLNTHFKVSTTALRAAYEAYCRGAGDRAVSTKALTTNLKGRWNVDGGRSSSERYYVGIRLAETYEKQNEATVIEDAPNDENDGDDRNDEQMQFWSDYRKKP